MIASAIAADESRAAREAAAHRYLAAVGPMSLVEEAALPALRGIPPVEAHEIAKLFTAELDMERIEALLIDGLADRFRETRRALNKMAEEFLFLGA